MSPKLRASRQATVEDEPEDVMLRDGDNEHETSPSSQLPDVPDVPQTSDSDLQNTRGIGADPLPFANPDDQVTVTPALHPAPHGHRDSSNIEETTLLRALQGIQQSLDAQGQFYRTFLENQAQVTRTLNSLCMDLRWAGDPTHNQAPPRFANPPIQVREETDSDYSFLGEPPGPTSPFPHHTRATPPHMTGGFGRDRTTKFPTRSPTSHQRQDTEHRTTPLSLDPHLRDLLPYQAQEQARVRRAKSSLFQPLNLAPTNIDGSVPSNWKSPAPRPDVFRGKLGTVESFLIQFVNYINISGQASWPDYLKIRLAATMMRDEASRWISSLFETNPHPKEVLDWDAFVGAMFQNFDRDCSPELAAANLRNLQQGSHSVTQYWLLFNHWARRSGWDQKALADTFRSGLKQWIQQRMSFQGVSFSTLHATYRYASNVEQAQHAVDLNNPSEWLIRQQRLDSRQRAQSRNKENTLPPSEQPKVITDGQRPSQPPRDGRPQRDGSRPRFNADRKRITRFNAIRETSPGRESPPQDDKDPASSPASASTSLTDDEDQTPEQYVEDMYRSIGGYTEFDPFEPVASRALNNETPDDDWRTALETQKTLDNSTQQSLLLLRTMARSSHNVICTPVLLPVAPTRSFRALVDTGASLNFIDPSLVNELGLPLVPSETVPTVTLGDGRQAPVNHYVILTLLPGEGFEAYTAEFFVFPVGKPGLVLGVPFCKSHNPDLDWVNLCITPKPQPRDNTSLRAMINRNDHPRLLMQMREPDKGPEAIVGQLPTAFSDFEDVFREDLAEKLPEHSRFDHEILLNPGTVPRYGPIYKTSAPQSEYVRNYINENTDKGWISVSKSSWASPVLFANKKDGTPRMCIDYRYVNANTVKVRYPLPRIDQILDRLHAAQYYSKIDLRNAYNLIRIRRGDEHITAFRTQYGLFEYNVMPFGLCNAPATFQRLMNYIFRDMLDVSVVVYLDDILIFSKNRKQHTEHVREVLQRLRDNKLFAKASKCEFFSHSVSFLGYYIDREGISMDPSKVRSILDWPYPKQPRDILSFIGLANFYRNFIPGFAIATRPLYDAAKTQGPFILTPSIIDAWDNLKRIMSSNTVVRHFDPSLPCIVETDASDYAIGAVLSQTQDGITRPVAFLSRKLQPAELNYSTHDKELLAIVYAFGSWAHYLEGHQIDVRVLSDHQSLKYFTQKKLLSRRQASWHDFLARFAFHICYTPGKSHIKADALSRRPDYLPDDTTSTTKSKELNPQNEVVLLPPEIFLGTMRHVAVTAQSDLVDLLKQATAETDPETTKRFGLKLDKGLLYHEDQVFVPPCLVSAILTSCHDGPAMGHPGIVKTIQNLQHDYWWPSLKADAERYVRRCEVCQRTKPATGRPNGLLQPLPVADRPWQHLSCDFVGPLPMSSGFNFVLTVVDRFTKMAVFLPCTKNITSFEFAKLFVRKVYSRFGLPSTIVTDRGPQFTAMVWQSLATLLGINHRLSTAYHPQTDGQSEIVNKALGQYLRIFSNLEQTDWSSHLPYAEFCYNSTPHSATGIPPIVAYSGYEPRRSLDQPASSPDDKAVPRATRFAKDLNKLHKAMYKALADANERYAEVYNRRRRNIRFKEGEWVWLNTKNLRTMRPSKKLDNRFAGPYKIDKVINDLAYRLKIHDRTSLGRTFHIDLLKKFEGKEPKSDSEAPALSYGSTSPVSILASRTVRGQKQWKISWSTMEISWETEDTMKSFPDWPALRDSFVPRPRQQRPRPKDPNATPWKGWSWADTPAESSTREDRENNATTPSRLRPRRHLTAAQR